MARFEKTLSLSHPVSGVFAFFCRSAHLVALAHPDFKMKLVSGPEELSLGARLVWQGRRWGISQRFAIEITAFEIDRLIVAEQRQGPFRKWVHVQRFEILSPGTKISDGVDYEPPGGLLGLTITASAMAADLEKMWAYRDLKVREFFDS